ncbi:dermonecrotic toxin domain-containing protein [Pseudomonas frederiksbergensis]|uniref:dermonecrotic toxin domain-containing protein n=1 Tax=Pseudomonas frederiksbergensis TaxID=104087 RepID=UPI003D06EEC3
MNLPKDSQAIPFWPRHPDTHYAHLATALPMWLIKASANRRATLTDARPERISQLSSISPAQHRVLKRLNASYWTAQNSIDQHLGRLQDARAFGEPLLRAALKQQYGLDLDVNATWLRLYIPATTPWFPIKSGGARTWTVSLLDAALHNFEPAEAEDDAYEADSTYITQPSATGHFDVLRHIKNRLGIGAFARLCRELDIGKQYQAFLEENLGVSTPLVAAVLHPQIKDSHQAALRMALELAVIADEPLSNGTYRSIRGLVDGVQGMLLDGKPLLCHDLTLMSARLTGIVLFAPDLEQHRDTVPVIAYIPDDPEHPIKQYPSSARFMIDLSQRLRSKNYQQFFSRFVAHEDRGYFFADLNNRLTQTTWHQRSQGDPLPSWRETPAAHANLQFAATPIRGDLWTHLHQRKLDKILNDARTIAVSTANADRKARWERWDSFTGIASALLQVAAFVALPFVPFLGELMLAYTAYQLLDETFEGIVDWAEGLPRQALAHTLGVMEALVQLGIFAAGGNIVTTEFRQVLPREWIDFIDRFMPVKTTEGQTRYWNGDLKPYEHTSTPSEIIPDDLGLYRHDDKTFLLLEGKPYSVSKAATQEPFVIEHPTRPGAYKPRLKHNGNGSWQAEHEQPLTWDREKVLLRLGHLADNLSVGDRETVLSISGYHENALRRMLVDNEPLPSLLADTLKRFKIDRDLHTFIERLGSEQPATWLTADPATQLQLLTEQLRWPSDKALRLINGQGEVTWQSSTGERLYDIAANTGDVLKAALGHLDEAEIKALFDESFGAPSLALEVRVRQLRERILRVVQTQRSTLFEARYRAQERDVETLARQLMDAVPGLPSGSAQELLLSASAIELQQLEQGTLAPRLKELARWTQQQIRAVRARESLELESVDNPDAERLALHSLPRLPGWSANVRIEVKRYSFEGANIDSIGQPNAAVRKVLVQTEDGHYQPYNEIGEALASTDDFYNSLLRALPDTVRRKIKLNIGQGQALKHAVGQHALPLEELQSVLSSQPLLKPSYDPHLMRLPGGCDGYRQYHPERGSLNDRILDLFPSFTVQQVADYARILQEHPAGAHTELSRMYEEFRQLAEDLRIWANTPTTEHPITGAALTPEQLFVDAQNCHQLSRELQRCWRRQTALNDPDAQGGDPDYLFTFTRPIIGELPTLRADFSHISFVVLEGNEMTLGARAFLNHFTGMRRLVVRNIPLDSLPEVVATRPTMIQLILSNCRLSLGAEDQAVIASMTQLHTLDLCRNPLHASVSLEAMPALEYLDLNSCSLIDTPAGLVTRTNLRNAILSDNLISHLPVELFDLSSSRITGFDFSGNPLSEATRNRIKDSFQRIHEDFGVAAPHDDLERAARLYPRLRREDASDFVYRLPGTLADGRVELTRLENEYSTMVTALAAWTSDVPARHPDTGQPFTPQQLMIEHSIRDALKNRIEQAWRKEIEVDAFDDPIDPNETSYELVLDMIIIGDLPTLDADFSHVSHLFLSSDAGWTTVNSGFLRCFPRLKALTVHDYRMSTMPDAVFNMGNLRSLVITDSHLTLTPNTVAALAGMDRLYILDLSDNPLYLAPDVSQMANLNTLILHDTLLTELPNGVLRLPNLENANLSHNEILELPADLLELPLDIAEGMSLRANPFSDRSLQLLHAYFQNTGNDFGVEAIIDNAEMEVSHSEDSAIED